MWFSTIDLTGERGSLLMISTYQPRQSFNDTRRQQLTPRVCNVLCSSLSIAVNAKRANARCGLRSDGASRGHFQFHAFHSRPRPWRPDEVPVAFWSWRNQTPSDTDVGAAIEQTKARAIFLRAGQIDYQNGKLNRIRPLNGPLPKGIELHLVYNATRSLLSQMESVDEKLLAGEIAKAFQEDNARAMSEDACVFGLQIDIDVPTRLLSRYEGMLRALRGHLPPGLKLSITGLPTWMRSAELRSTLIQCGFLGPTVLRGRDSRARRSADSHLFAAGR